ncbi:polymeric immunoglobulin receptor isoform X2 [Cuculus canorus]|uniref:polymeric immunoglobulin receptor isoform X2 n=1 Tax=Cuculus canorus TaxID=55661 RepID=UPI0023AA40AE|nr:polymeric immunoglobulin receptor isoform X2 [Cuculus canorus]
MTLLALIFLLAFLPAESARGRYLPKAAISSHVFGPGQVYGLLNGSVTVKCFYPPTSVNRHDRKYWCKQSSMGCITVVSSRGYTAPGYQGRASITNYPQEENFEINITGLTMADTGTYQCGIGINGRGLSHRVNLEVTKGPHIPEGAELFYVKLYSTLTMSCSFGESTASMRKYLCKMEKSGCRNIIDSHGVVDQEYTGRAILSNEEPPGTFSIVITQMDWEDTGLYMCGVGSYGQNGETKELDVHVYEETSAPQGKPAIIGVKGSSVTFTYHYEGLDTSLTKYWCKWRQYGCARIIDNTGFVSGLYEGRVAMFDSPENKSVTIILNQLKDSDKGYYWFMTDEVKEQQASTELKIIDGEPGLKGKTEVEAQTGSRVNLTCFYPCKYYSYQKYWCKWSSTSCNLMPSSDQRQPGPDVTCDTDNKVVILSFDPVTKADEGWYWCGVKRNVLYGETMAVYLQVTEGEVGRSANRNLDLLDVDADNHVEVPSQAEGGSSPQGRASGSAVQSPSSGQTHSETMVQVLVPVGAAILIVATAFAIFKYRQLKRSDLVSVGSYRTNISMSDFESVKEYSASNNACVQESQETPIGGDEFVTATVTPESVAETKKAKRSSKEDADLAYSAFLLTSSSVAQGSAGADNTAEPQARD